MIRAQAGAEERPFEDTEDNHLQVKERDFRRNQPGQYFDLELPASRNVRK